MIGSVPGNRRNQSMPIRFCSGPGCETVPVGVFSKEKELENLLAECPELLGGEDGPAIALVAQQVHLPEAGILDLLFVDGDGLPIAVEVKKESNPESPRAVIGQVIDYLSSLTALTVDELDTLVNGRLETALRELTDEGDDPEFERVWQAMGANLRAGQARLVVALDEAPPALERIFRFLARNSYLDVQLLTVQRYSSPRMGDVFVPRTVVDPAAESTSIVRKIRPTCPELAAVIDTYNNMAQPDVHATLRSWALGVVRPSGWPVGIRYHFWRQNSETMVITLAVTSKKLHFLDSYLAPFDVQPVANGYAKLRWNPDNHKLSVKFPLTERPETIAQAMLDLVSLTRAPVTEGLEKGIGTGRAVN
jgi:hypothetical protein